MAGPKSKGKPMMSLVPEEAVAGIAKALEYGIQKHGKNEFRDNKITQTEVIDSLLRHTYAYLSGQDIDEDSGLSHVQCIGANYAMLEFKRVNKPELDDRWKQIEKKPEDIRVFVPYGEVYQPNTKYNSIIFEPGIGVYNEKDKK